MTGPSPDFYLNIYSCTHRVGCVSSCWMRLGGLGILPDLKPHCVKVPPRAWLRDALIPYFTSLPEGHSNYNLYKLVSGTRLFS